MHILSFYGDEDGGCGDEVTTVEQVQQSDADNAVEPRELERTLNDCRRIARNSNGARMSQWRNSKSVVSLSEDLYSADSAD
jgi:hypothetical protein